jgi:hypothetical protein
MAIDNPIDAVESQYKQSPEAPLGLVLLPAELALPHVAPLLKFVELIRDHFSSRERTERAQAFLDLLRDQQKVLQVLGKNFDGLNVKVDDLAEAVQLAVFRDAEAFNDNKRDRYLKILGSAVRSEHKIQDLASFIRDVEALGEEDITVLKVLNTVMNRGGDPPNQLTFLLGQRKKELADSIAQSLHARANVPTKDGMSYSHEEGYAVCLRLQGFGLATAVPFNAVQEIPVREYCFRPSKRGLMFLNLIGEQVPNWAQYFPPQRDTSDHRRL